MRRPGIRCSAVGWPHPQPGVPPHIAITPPLGLRDRQNRRRPANAAARLAVELVIDIEDLNGERVVMEGDDTGEKMSRPGTVLTPPAAAATRSRYIAREP